MPRNGVGTMNLVAGNPVTTGTTISSTWANNTLTDIANALSTSVASDGQTAITANLPMSGFHHIGVADAQARTDYASAGQVQDNYLTNLTSISGTNILTAFAPNGMNAYATGQKFTLIATGANTGAVTLNINGIGAKPVTKNGTTALTTGDIISGRAYEVIYDGTQFQVIGIAASTLATSTAIASVSLTSNIVTINTSAAHGISVGNNVTVTATTITAVNGTFTVLTVPTTTSFTYAKTNADIALTTDTGTVVNNSFINLSTNVTGTLGTSNIANNAITPAKLANSGFELGMRNRIINGAMQVWQRGTSFSAVGGSYLADRWVASQTFIAAQSTDAPPNAKYSLDITAGAGSYGTIAQRIESANCIDLVGQSVTISLWAKRVSGTSNITLGLKYANAVDNFSTTTDIGSTVQLVPTSSWTYFTVTFTNLPAGAANGLQLNVYTDSSACQIRYSLFQLEKGATATPFDYRPYGTELALCQRYFIKWGINSDGGGYASFGSGYVVSATSVNINIQYPVQMRGTATFAQSNCAILEAGGAFAVTALGTSYIGQQSALLGCTVASGLTTGRAATLNANNNVAGFITAASEL